tara:strand:- start:9 stop:950 length:942 start_codon:yes stop_codon:yes gene_type:complete
MTKLPDINDPLCEEVFNKTKSEIESLSSKLKIDNLSEEFFKEIVIPLAIYFNSLKIKKDPYLIGFTGGQGSGKTTLSDFVQLVLQVGFDKTTTGFSIDDLYKTPEERNILAETIHPLCKVRGVPGTHNIKLGLDVLNSLYNANSYTQTSIPSFSKTQDRHLPEDVWIKFIGKPDFIFFDAWFGGAKPVSCESWQPPINKLEKEEDPDGIWSKWSNNELAGEYQNLFNKIDLLLMIKVPGMNDIFESRWLQEQTLKKTISKNMSDNKIMNKDEVWNFVMHYERLTRYVLEEVPKFSDIVLNRDKNFDFSFVKKP